MQEWQTRRIEQLERELCKAHATIECQEMQIEALRAKVGPLETSLRELGEYITSHVASNSVLKQAAHAQAFC